MKASDWIAGWLKERVGHVFGLQGGAVVHLFDSCHAVGPEPIYCHHEQAAAFAASAYARIHGYGVCILTTGPGGTNGLTPLLGAWQDSIPCLFISGQARVAHTSYGKPVRQAGTQEAPIADIVRPIVKAAIHVERMADVARALNAAYKASRAARNGPAWVDIPFDLQNAPWA